MIIFQHLETVNKGGRIYSEVTLNNRHYMVEKNGETFGVAPMFGFSRCFRKDKRYIQNAMTRGFDATKGSIILSRSDSAEDITPDETIKKIRLVHVFNPRALSNGEHTRAQSLSA
jgi:hypothetical protein